MELEALYEVWGDNTNIVLKKNPTNCMVSVCVCVCACVCVRGRGVGVWVGVGVSVTVAIIIRTQVKYHAYGCGTQNNICGVTCCR